MAITTELVSRALLLEHKSLFEVAARVSVPKNFFDNSSDCYSDQLPCDITKLYRIVKAKLDDCAKVYFSIDKSLVKISYFDLTLENNETLHENVSGNENNLDLEDDGSFSEDISDDCDPEYQPDSPKRSRIDDSGSSSDSSIYGFSEEVEFADKEVVFLMHNSKVLFKAMVFQEFEIDNPHCLKLKIIKVYRKNATLWNDFDEDKHTAGSFIKWSKCQIKKTIPRSASEINQSLGLEADYPIPLAQRKRKRNLEQWRKNVKRKKQRSGESYEYKTKKGEVKVMKAKKVKQGCNPERKKNVVTKFLIMSEKISIRVFGIFKTLQRNDCLFQRW